jgi:hypothetical protein
MRRAFTSARANGTIVATTANITVITDITVGTEHTRPTPATLMDIGTTTAIRGAEDPISRSKMEFVSLTPAAKRSACVTPEVGH